MQRNTSPNVQLSTFYLSVRLSVCDLVAVIHRSLGLSLRLVQESYTNQTSAARLSSVRSLSDSHISHTGEMNFYP